MSEVARERNYHSLAHFLLLVASASNLEYRNYSTVKGRRQAKINRWQRRRRNSSNKKLSRSVLKTGKQIFLSRPILMYFDVVKCENLPKLVSQLNICRITKKKNDKISLYSPKKAKIRSSFLIWLCKFVICVCPYPCSILLSYFHFSCSKLLGRCKNEEISDKLCGGVISRTIFSTGNRLFIQTQTSYPLYSIFAHYIGIRLKFLAFSWRRTSYREEFVLLMTFSCLWWTYYWWGRYYSKSAISRKLFPWCRMQMDNYGFGRLSSCFDIPIF